MLEDIRRYCDQARVKLVDWDLLEFEAARASKEDQDLLMKALSGGDALIGKLPNPYNSILLYVTGLTNQFDLIKGRADTIGGSPPDADLDFDKLDVDKAIQWTVNKWGRECVAAVAARATFKPKSITNRYFTAVGGRDDIRSELLKLIPPSKYGKEASIKEIVSAVGSAKFATLDPEFYKAALKLEDMVSHFTIHAAGLVVADKPLYEYIPIWSNKTAERITQYDKDELEGLGLLKFDFLKIDSLSVVKEASRLIEQYHGVVIDIYQIPDHDKAAYATLHSGHLAGIFQMEASSVAKDLIKRIKPMSIEELSAVNALNRPGPMQAGLDREYVYNKDYSVVPADMPDELREILKETYYTFVYQEQVMAMCRVLAGFNLKEADDIRRALGKKKEKELIIWREGFLEGCARIGIISKRYADELWELLAGDPRDSRKHGLADYLFNKSHSIAYSYLTYVTAWMKAHYPLEFFCALMSVKSQTMQPDVWARKAPEFVGEARKLGIEVNPPSINGSEIGFRISDGEIYFGLNGIRDLGDTAVSSIIKARGKKPFSDVFDFLNRVNLRKINTKAFNALVKAGAFDKLGYDRNSLAENTQALFDYVRGQVEYQERLQAVETRTQEIKDIEGLIEKRDLLNKQIKKHGAESLTTDDGEWYRSYGTTRRPVALRTPTPPIRPEPIRGRTVELTIKHVMEQAYYVGCYVDQHPIQMLNIEGQDLYVVDTGEYVTVRGVVTKLKKFKTKAGPVMAFMEIDDSTLSGEVTILPHIWARLDVDSLEEGSLVVVTGKVEGIEPVKILAKNIQLVDVSGL